MCLDYPEYNWFYDGGFVPIIAFAIFLFMMIVVACFYRRKEKNKFSGKLDQTFA